MFDPDKELEEEERRMREEQEKLLDYKAGSVFKVLVDNNLRLKNTVKPFKVNFFSTEDYKNISRFPMCEFKDYKMGNTSLKEVFSYIERKENAGEIIVLKGWLEL